MKSVGLLGIVLFGAACMGSDEPQTSTTTSALTERSSSEPWDTKNTVDDIWPDGANQCQVLYRKGPAYNGAASFLAFVVWNHNTVGHVYWIPVGPLGTDFKSTFNTAFSQRTNTPNNPLGDHWGGGTGGGGVGTPPAPHPQVNDPLVFSNAYLNAAKTAAAAIDNADANFNAYSE